MTPEPPRKTAVAALLTLALLIAFGEIAQGLAGLSRAANPHQPFKSPVLRPAQEIPP